jgi:hypothetical protein
MNKILRQNICHSSTDLCTCENVNNVCIPEEKKLYISPEHTKKILLDARWQCHDIPRLFPANTTVFHKKKYTKMDRIPQIVRLHESMAHKGMYVYEENVMVFRTSYISRDSNVSLFSWTLTHVCKCFYERHSYWFKKTLISSPLMNWDYYTNCRILIMRLQVEWCLHQPYDWNKQHVQPE